MMNQHKKMLRDANHQGAVAHPFNQLPPEIITYSILEYVSLGDIPSLLCLNKWWKEVADSNISWRHRFTFTIPTCQMEYFDKYFECVWRSNLFGKIKNTNTASSMASKKDISYKKLFKSVFGKY